MTAGCQVRDDGRMCPNGAFLDEHVLRDGVWLHPVGVDRDGRFVFDEEDGS